jgi:hypothetical protein
MNASYGYFIKDFIIPASCDPVYKDGEYVCLEKGCASGVDVW